MSYALSGQKRLFASNLVQWRLTRYHVTIRFDDQSAEVIAVAAKQPGYAFRGARVGIQEVQIRAPEPADPAVTSAIFNTRRLKPRTVQRDGIDTHMDNDSAPFRFPHRTRG